MVGQLVFAVPYIPPAPPAPAFAGMPMTWTGWDGSVWDLTGATGGVCLQPGVRGLEAPAGTAYIDEPAGVDGGSYRGYRTGVRDVFWPVRVWHDESSRAWMDYDRAFRRTLDPDLPGTWTVQLPDGRSRSLRCRWVGNDASGSVSDIDPMLMGWALYGMRLVAVDPFWRGERVVSGPWQQPVASPFHPEGGGPPFTITEGGGLAGAAITNDGDVLAWPTWWVTDVASANLALAGRTINVPDVDEGKLLVIDTDPRVQTAVEIDLWDGEPTRDEQIAWVEERVPAGVSRTRALGGSRFAPVPARGASPVSLTVVGDGWVQASIVPRYRSAW